jgi:two-component SAPR family response regulator
MPGNEPSLLVLIVDDQEVIADSLCFILNENGFDARAVYSDETAIVLARVLRPDILISDIRMGGTTGIELAIKIEDEFPDCRIILYSGHSETVDRQNSDRHSNQRVGRSARLLFARMILTSCGAC